MIVAYKAKPEDGWTVHKCRLSGRMDLDAYAACYQARRYVREGNAEAQVLEGANVFARFYRSATGDVIQEGGAVL